jgi:hypothetical protein
VPRPIPAPPQVAGTEVLAYVNRVRDVEAAGVDHAGMSLADIEANPVRCPDPASAELMYKGEARVGGCVLWVGGCVFWGGREGGGGGLKYVH